MVLMRYNLFHSPSVLLRRPVAGTRFVTFADPSGTSLTKAVDMGHTWSKYGNGMGQPMTNVWVLYGFYMGH